MYSHLEIAGCEKHFERRRRWFDPSGFVLRDHLLKSPLFGSHLLLRHTRQPSGSLDDFGSVATSMHFLLQPPIPFLAFELSVHEVVHRIRLPDKSALLELSVLPRRVVLDFDRRRFNPLMLADPPQYRFRHADIDQLPSWNAL